LRPYFRRTASASRRRRIGESRRLKNITNPFVEALRPGRRKLALAEFSSEAYTPPPYTGGRFYEFLADWVNCSLERLQGVHCSFNWLRGVNGSHRMAAGPVLEPDRHPRRWAVTTRR
jgi:hypothetical protein